MFKRIIIVALVSALLTANAGAYEPGGFNGKLYAGEVAVGSAMTVTPILFGIVAYSSAVA
jgi:hypothetical protein